ncbi:HEAT repeat domain-containing protein, partial [Candidatus Micrarchaeota archaeon]|nr:HEAT repeat domain-containing protein [Candidatus Micrarchaeota archaeon]
MRQKTKGNIKGKTGIKKEPLADAKLTEKIRNLLKGRETEKIIEMCKENEEYLPVLAGFLDDEEWIIQIRTAETLREIKNPKSVPALIGALNLLRYQNVNPEDIFNADCISFYDMEYEDDHIGDVAASQNNSFRIEVVRALGKIGDPSAGDALIQVLLKDKRRDLRIMAAEALGSIKSSDAVEALIETFRDKEEYMRDSAIRALAELEDPKIKLLSGMLEHKELRVRRSVLLALIKITCSEEFLIKWIEKEEELPLKELKELLETEKFMEVITKLLQSAGILRLAQDKVWKFTEL